MAISIHPFVDQGVMEGKAGFAGGILTCKCTHDSVTVKVESDVAYHHACGCTRCWRPTGALFAIVGIVKCDKVQVLTNEHKLAIVDPSHCIQRHACSGCGVHMYGRIERTTHPLFGLDFIHVELSAERGWAAPQFAGMVSSLIESGVQPALMPAIRARLKELRLEAYDCMSPALMDLIAIDAAKKKGTLAA